MRPLLILLNLALLVAIVVVAFFWQPAVEENKPLPGTHAARQGSDVSPRGEQR